MSAGLGEAGARLDQSERPVEGLDQSEESQASGDVSREGRLVVPRGKACNVGLLEIDPTFMISAWIARGGQSNAKLLTDGLRKAGLPE
jgi:hypothetical protein